MRERGLGRWWMLPVAAAVVAGVLIGCDGDPPDPAPPPTPTSAPDPSPTPAPSTEAPPALPAAATAGDAAGAEAFVKHWVDVLNYANRTGDAAALQSISEPRCEVCEELLSDIRTRNQLGETFRDGTSRLKLVASPVPENGLVTVAAQFGQEPGTILSADGTQRPVTGSELQNVGLVALYTDGRWMLGGIGTI